MADSATSSRREFLLGAGLGAAAAATFVATPRRVSLEAEETAIRAEAAKLTERARVKARRSEWLRMYLAQWLPAGEKIEDTRVRVRVGTAESLEIAADADTPAEYMVPKFSPDKKAIKAALQGGADIPGHRIVTKKHVVIK